MELQHINVKLMLATPDEVDLEPLVPVFHSWIEQQAPGDLLLDIADYRHVPAGPGIILIGYQGDLSVDNAQDRLGVRYNRKAELDGDNESRLRQAAIAALTACRRLESDARLDGKLLLRRQGSRAFSSTIACLPRIMSSTRHSAEPELARLLRQALRRRTLLALAFENEPRQLFSARAKAEKTFTASDLLANIDS